MNENRMSGDSGPPQKEEQALMVWAERVGNTWEGLVTVAPRSKVVDIVKANHHDRHLRTITGDFAPYSHKLHSEIHDLRGHPSPESVAELVKSTIQRVLNPAPPSQERVHHLDDDCQGETIR